MYGRGEVRKSNHTIKYTETESYEHLSWRCSTNGGEGHVRFWKRVREQNSGCGVRLRRQKRVAQKKMCLRETGGLRETPVLGSDASG